MSADTVSEEDVAKLYLGLIDLSLSLNIPIREDCRVPRESPYQYFHEPKQIRVYRSTQPADPWVDSSSSHERKLALVSRNESSLHELIAIAHELGHSFSQDDSIEPLYDKARTGKFLSSQEIERIIAEEEFAWNKAEELLRSIGFSWWNRFKTQKSEALTSYGRLRASQSQNSQSGSQS